MEEQMALETGYPKRPKRPEGPLAKDEPQDKPHDTTSNLGKDGSGFYGTTEGVKETEEQFEQVLVPKKDASNVTEEDEEPVKGKKK